MFIDTLVHLQEHPDISKSERKRICKLMDCRKLSVDACTHAVQNERLPMRVVVQVLFFEQARGATTAGSGNTPEMPGSLRALLPGGSHGSSRSATTNTEEEWDAIGGCTEELKALRLKDNDNNTSDGKGNAEKLMAANKVRGLIMSRKILSKIWSNKEKSSENSSSDTSSSNAEETKSTPSRSRRHSLS